VQLGQAGFVLERGIRFPVPLGLSHSVGNRIAA